METFALNIFRKSNFLQIVDFKSEISLKKNYICWPLGGTGKKL